MGFNSAFNGLIDGFYLFLKISFSSQVESQGTLNVSHNPKNSLFFFLSGRVRDSQLHISWQSASSSSRSGRIRFDSCSLYPQNVIGPSISSSVVLCVFVLLVYIVVLV